MEDTKITTGANGYVVPQQWLHHYRLDLGINVPVNNMIAIHTIGDGSCLIHAILQAYHRPYVLGQIDRRDFVRELRRSLSQQLSEPADLIVNNLTSSSITVKTWYQIINRGGLTKLSSDPGKVPDDIKQRMLLHNMQNELDSCQPLDNLYDDYLSKILNKNIFVIDLHTKSVKYNIDGDILLSPNRNCVVILDKNGHYETVGIKENDVISTYFHWNHPFIIQLRLLM